MLKIFLDKEFAEKEFRAQQFSASEFAASVLPQLGDYSSYMFNRLSTYEVMRATRLFEPIENPRNCDAILLPVDWGIVWRRTPSFAKHYIDLAAKCGKPLIISSLGDTTEDIPGQIVLRTSKYKWSKRKNEIFCPPVVDDRLSSNKLDLIYKPQLPTIGFVGQSVKNSKKYSLGRLLKYGKLDYVFTAANLLDKRYGSRRSGLFFRTKAMNALEGHPQITCNFVRRNQWGLDVRKSPKVLEDQTSEYDQNIKNNLFTLCARGAGNFSLRLYEVLSMGRLPLLIDTDDVRPCDDYLDYKRFCFIVHWTNIDNIAELLTEFYQTRTVEDLNEMQILAREAFEKHLEFSAFSKNLFHNVIPKTLHHGL